MSDLDEKLKKLVMRHGWITESDNWQEAIDDIKQAFAEELGIDKMLQDMVNLRATMEQEMIRLGMTSADPRLMTGQEWYGRMGAEVAKLLSLKLHPAEYNSAEIMEAAKKAAGLE